MKRATKVISTILVFFLLAIACRQPGKEKDASNQIFVAAYYFPNYHTGDPRNEQRLGTGWSEWELLKAAKPRFPRQQQPKVPAWGYVDEKDPAVMAMKIDTATAYGIDCFIFDWYIYNDGPFLNRCIDEGFLKAPNNEKIKFAFMWANHDWVELFPYTRGAEQKLIYPGKVTPERFEEIGDLLIRDYFSRPNYWKIEGKPYFSVYDVQKFVESFGNIEATKAAMERLDEKAVKAGLNGIHWNLVAWGRPVLPVENPPADTPALIKALGFNSATSYVWVHHAGLPETQTPYNQVRDKYFEHWENAKATFGVPYFPNVSMGWDPSPRCDLNSEWAPVGYPFTNTIGENTPENFKQALQLTKDKLLADQNGPRILNINCWNEWTEGSYLEPDTIHGMKYLEAVREVFKSKGKKL
jgi:hypothetical protein